MKFTIKGYSIIINLYKELTNLQLSKNDLEEKNAIKNIKKNIAIANNDNIILLPLYDDFGMLKMSYALIEIISKSKPVNLKYFHIYTAVDNNEYYNTINIFKKFYYRFKNFLKRKKASKILSINSKDIIGNNFQDFNLDKKINIFSNKNQILEIQHKDVIIGDLIYDHYLRFFEKPTIDLNDPQLYSIINYANLLVEYWFDKLKKINPKFIVLPYTAYLHWGIISRVALSKNIQVINIGSTLYILQALEKSHPYHSKNFQLYNKIWNSLDAKEEKIKFAKTKLESRLNGSVDDLYYMKNSAYSSISSNSLVKTKEKNAVIFLHCFFDSPHIYGNGLFADFFEWVEHILNIAKANVNINYYFKQHPNGLQGNDEIISWFKNKYINYTNIIFLDKNISNLEINKFKPDVIFTFYGTVAQEFAYLQYPVVLAGDSPMKNYKFCYQPKNINELNYYLKEVGNYTAPIDFDEEELLSFYYMHYNYFSEKFNSENFNLKKNFKTGEINIPISEHLYSLFYNKAKIFF